MTLTIPQLYDTMYVRYNPYAEEARHADDEALQDRQGPEARSPAAARPRDAALARNGRPQVFPLHRLRVRPLVADPMNDARREQKRLM